MSDLIDRDELINRITGYLDVTEKFDSSTMLRIVEYEIKDMPSSFQIDDVIPLRFIEEQIKECNSKADYCRHQFGSESEAEQSKAEASILRKLLNEWSEQ